MGPAASPPLGMSPARPEWADAAVLERRAQRRTGAAPSARRHSGGGSSRRRLATLAGAVVALWIVLVFARAVADGAGTAARAQALRLDTVLAASKLVSERAELMLIQTPAYVRLEARAYGYGPPGERAFALAAGGPAAPVITPLGADPTATRVRSPLEAWLGLLFGP
jgi:hypothetical protein